MDDINATYSANDDYSHLLLHSSKNTDRKKAQPENKMLHAYSSKTLSSQTAYVQNFLMMNQPPSHKHTGKGNKVFARLHNHALVKQKKKTEITTKSQKKLHSGKEQLAKSKSGYIKPDCGGSKVHTNRTSTIKPPACEYDANVGQRLYVKSRGLSSKRERSLKRIRRRKSMQEAKEQEKLSKTSLMSPQSKWILDEKMYGSNCLDDKNWLCKDGDQVRYA